jgi:Flp pilus assembly protein TadD
MKPLFAGGRPLALVAVCMMLLGSGCRNLSTTDLARSRAEARERADLELRSLAYAHYAAGVVHEMAGESGPAAEEFLQAAWCQPEDAELLADLAGRLIEARRYDEACEVLRLAAKLPDADGMVFVRQGYVFTQMGEERKALQAHREAVKRMPDFWPARQNLYLSLVAAGKADEAWEVLEAARQRQPLSIEARLALAEYYADFGRRFPSRETVARAAGVNLLEGGRPFVTGLLAIKWADVLYQLGETGAAAEIYLEVVDREALTPPLRERLRAKLADIYLRRADQARAVSQLEAILVENPANPGAHYFLGAIAFNQQRWPEAIRHYQRAVELQPEFEPARMDLVLAQIAAGRREEAESGLDELRKRRGATFQTEYLEGMICHERKDFAAAVRHLEAAEQLAQAQDTNRLTDGFYFQLGVAQERAGQREKAVRSFEGAIRLQPDNADALNYLGYLWAERGENLARAQELIERALKLEPESEAILDSMGWVLFQRGDLTGARRFLEQAAARANPPDATIYDHLGDVYAAAKEFERARQAWAKSFSIVPNPEVQKKLEQASP